MLALIVVCAWCRQEGQPTGSSRHPKDKRWFSTPHREVAIATRLQIASHGICPTCLRKVKDRYDATRPHSLAGATR